MSKIFAIHENFEWLPPSVGGNASRGWQEA